LEEQKEKVFPFLIISKIIKNFPLNLDFFSTPPPPFLELDVFKGNDYLKIHLYNE